MMKFRTLDYLCNIVITISGLALLLLILELAFSVYTRYVRNDPLSYSDELAKLLILIVALPLAAVCLREQSHLSITLLTAKLSAKAARRVDILNSFVLLAFGIAMIYYPLLLMQIIWRSKIPTLGISQGYHYLPLVVTGMLIVLFMLESLWFLITKKSQ